MGKPLFAFVKNKNDNNVINILLPIIKKYQSRAGVL
jgi:hypothetical protein